MVNNSLSVGAIERQVAVECQKMFKRTKKEDSWQFIKGFIKETVIKQHYQ